MTIKIIRGADHFFVGHLDELKQAITEWMAEQQTADSRQQKPDVCCCCLLLAVCCLLFAVCCSLFAVRCLLFAVCCLLLRYPHELLHRSRDTNYAPAARYKFSRHNFRRRYFELHRHGRRH